MRKIILFVAVMMVLFSSQKIQAQWAEVGGLNGLAANGPIKTMCTDPAGNIYAAGGFRNDSGKFYVAKWDGSSWSELGGANGIKANDTINTICSDNQGNIYAGGKFINADFSNSLVEKWDGNNWSVLPNPFGNTYWNSINSICSDTAGNIYIVGDLWTGMQGPFIAKWDGNIVNKIAFGTATLNCKVYTVCSDSLGKVFTSGLYGADGRVMFLDGNTMTDYGGNIWAYGFVSYSICSDNQGNIYAGGTLRNGNYPGIGNYYVAKGNGITWTELGGKDALAANHPIRSVFRDGLGRIFAGGDFTNASGKNYVAKFDGMCWTELGGVNSLAANNTIRTICTDTAGNIYVAGDFTNANGKYYVAVLSKSLGINETSTSSISISPNPTKDIITIKGITEPTIAVYNLMGQKLVSSQDSKEVSLAQLPAGMYLVQVFNNDMELVKSEKVIRE